MKAIDKVKATGGFVDFGPAGSMPWGVYMNGELVDSFQYGELMKLKGNGYGLKPIKIISARRFKRTRWLVSKRYKVFGVTIFKRYHTGVLYKCIK